MRSMQHHHHSDNHQRQVSNINLLFCWYALYVLAIGFTTATTPSSLPIVLGYVPSVQSRSNHQQSKTNDSIALHSCSRHRSPLPPQSSTHHPSHTTTICKQRTIRPSKLIILWNFTCCKYCVRYCIWCAYQALCFILTHLLRCDER